MRNTRLPSQIKVVTAAIPTAILYRGVSYPNASTYATQLVTL